MKFDVIFFWFYQIFKHFVQFGSLFQLPACNRKIFFELNQDDTFNIYCIRGKKIKAPIRICIAASFFKNFYEVFVYT